MITFRKYKKSDKKTINNFIREYYKEDPPIYPDIRPNINKTILEFQKNPKKGTIYIFTKDKKIMGYSIVVYYWSNEWSGNWLIIDELYVDYNYRKQGIGTDFFKFLKKQRKKNDIGIQLEIHPHNKKVINFYYKL